MTNKSKKPVKPVEKPFLTGSPADERTVRSALAFFGVMILTVFVSFLVCTMMNMGSDLLRIGLNLAVVILVMFIFYNNAVSRGAEAVARGEILWQRQEKGHPFTEKERAICFHPAKGYVTGLLAISLMLLFIYLIRILQNAKILRKVLCFFGKYSLEFYLLHVALWGILAGAGATLYKPGSYMMLICASMIMAPLLSKVTAFITRKEHTAHENANSDAAIN